MDDARRYIGAVDRDIEAAQRRSDIMRDLWQDISYAARKLRAAPAFTARRDRHAGARHRRQHGDLLRRERRAAQAAAISAGRPLGARRYTQQGHGDAGTPMDIVDNRTRATKFVGFSVIEGTTANLIRDNNDAERVQGVRVGANWFDLLRIKPLVRTILPRGRRQAERAERRRAQRTALAPRFLRRSRGDRKVGPHQCAHRTRS